MAKNNFPSNALEEVSGEYAQETTKSLKELYDMGKPTSDDDVEKRIDDYFAFCEQSSIRPGVESLGLALSVSRTALWNWEHGINCSPRRQELITKAKTFIIAYLEQAMLTNKIYPGSAIFMLKNWAGYRDQMDINTTQSVANNAPALSQDEIHQIAVQAAETDVSKLLRDLPD